MPNLALFNFALLTSLLLAGPLGDRTPDGSVGDASPSGDFSADDDR